MLKRICLITMVLMAVVLINNSVFATRAVYAASSVEIISPQIGNEGDVVLKKDELYVNLRLKGSAPVYMYLYKVDPNGGYVEDPLAGQVLPLNTYYQLPENNKQQVHKSLTARYNKAKYNYAITKKTYKEALIAVKKVFGDVAHMDKIKQLSPYQRQVADQYKRAYSEYAQAKSQFNTFEAQYENLFATLIYGGVEIKSGTVMPYYKAVISNVKPGSYKMVFAEASNGSKIFKTVRFNVTTSEAAVDQIIETIPDSMNEIWTVPIP